MDLLNLRDFHGSQISPDGKWVAFVLGQAVYDSNSYRSGLFVVSTEKNSKPISLGSAGPPHWDDINQWWPENPQWSADSQLIYYRMKSAETWQVWRWKREGGRPVQVTRFERNVQSFQIAPDGPKLVLAVEKPSRVDPKQLAEHGILYDGSFPAGEPKPLLHQIRDALAIETETWFHDLRDGRDRKATDAETKAYTLLESGIDEKLFSKKEIEELHIVRAKISPDGQSVVYQTSVDDPSASANLVYPLFVKPTVGGKPVALTPNVYYVEQFWWSPDSKQIYYTQYDDTGADDLLPSKLMVVSASGGETRKISDSPGYLHDYSVDRSGRFLACIYDNNNVPPELELLDASTGETRLLVDVNPEVQNLQLSPAKRIDVFDKRGNHYWGHLVFPLNYESGKRYPLIITTYRDGDTFLRGGAGDEYPIQAFAANGFAVLNFDFGRVRNSKPGDFETKLLFFVSPMEGIDASITRLADQGIVDRSRVAMTGLSHGAEMVDYGISHTSLFRAAIASGSGWDPILYELSSDFLRCNMRQQFGLESPDGDTRGRWQRVSPALNALHVRTPLLINAADSEYANGMQWVTALRDLKKPIEMFIYADELHVKNQPKHRYEIYQRNVDWCNFWLQDKEDPDPAKAEQYTRWRGLRKLEENDATKSIDAAQARPE